MQEKKHLKAKRRILVISDGKRGHAHQTEGIVRKLHGVVGKKLEVRMSKPFYLFLVLMAFLARRIKFPQGIVFYWVEKVSSASLPSLIRFTPDLIICAGSITHPVAYLLGKVWKCRTVVCMRPSLLSPRDFSLVVAPRHDSHRCSGENVIYTMGATSHISEGFIFAEAVALYPKLKGNVKRPIGLLVGGDSALNFIDAETAAELAKEVSLLCEENNLSLLATTSRRTAPAAEAEIRKEFAENPRTAYLLLASESQENPVPGIIGLSEIVMVTEDSVSMVSEIISGGKRAVVIKVGRKKKRNKFETLFNDLMNENYIVYTSIKDLNRNMTSLLSMQRQGMMKPLDESKKVAQEIERRFFAGPSAGKGAMMQ